MKKLLLIATVLTVTSAGAKELTDQNTLDVAVALIRANGFYCPTPIARAFAVQGRDDLVHVMCRYGEQFQIIYDRGNFRVRAGWR
jgi:hypothetical protein